MSEPLDLFGTTLADLELNALEEVEKMVWEVKPDYVFAGFSGGNDSLATSLIASQHPAFSGLLHVNTGIGIPETRRFVRETALEQGWEFFERLPPRMQYVDIVLRFGFPGPPMHSWVYRWLKDKAIHAFLAEMKQKTKGAKVLLLAGQRKQESKRRMGFATRLMKDGNLTWGGPILDWPNGAPKAYAKSKGVRTNAVNDHLHMSGECLCGCFASPGEFALIDAFYPEVGEHIRWIEGLARKKGVWASWENPRPSYPKAHPEMPELGDEAGPMCASCGPGKPNYSGQLEAG